VEGVGGRSDNLLSIRLKPKVSMRQWNRMKWNDAAGEGN